MEQFYEHLLIITDLEPDDLIGLYLLFSDPRMKSKIIQVIVSGWVDPLNKARVFDYFASFFGLNINIFIGESSDNKFNYPPVNTTKNYPSWKNINIKNPLSIISMAPVKELMMMYSANPLIFTKCNLFAYGSFNFRVNMDISDMIKSFDKVLIYESYYATGVKNSVELKCKHPLLKLVIKKWNKDILNDCYETINSSTNNNQIDRNQKVINSINTCPGQFVNADTGLISSLLMGVESVGVNLSFNESGYTVMENMEGSKIRTIKGDNSLMERQVEFMQGILEEGVVIGDYRDKKFATGKEIITSGEVDISKLTKLGISVAVLGMILVGLWFMSS